MKYTIFGFSQKKLFDLGLGMNHAAILNWFNDFSGTDKMVKIIIEGKTFYWVKYEAIVEEYPILRVSKDRVYRFFKELVSAGILEHYTLKQGGTFSYYRKSNAFVTLKYNQDEEAPVVKKKKGTVKKPKGSGENNGTRSGENNGTNNPPTKYNPPTKESNAVVPTADKKHSKEAKPLVDALWKYLEKNNNLPSGKKDTASFYPRELNIVDNLLDKYSLDEIIIVLKYTESDSYWKYHFSSYSQFQKLRAAYLFSKEKRKSSSNAERRASAAEEFLSGK